MKFSDSISVHRLGIVCALCACIIVPAHAQAPAGYSVAVLPFEVSVKNLKGAGEDLQTLLTAQLSGESELILVERAEIDAALSEVELGKSGPSIRPPPPRSVTSPEPRCS